MIELSSSSSVSLIKTNANDLDVARAAWVSLDSDPREKESGRVPGLIKYLYENKHYSCFEHGSFTFRVETPIFVAREFMRHRTFSYNEYSGRYAEMLPKFYLPAEERPLVQSGKVGAYTFEPGSYNQYAAVRGMTRIYGEAWDKYIGMKEAGVANEVARMVLPVSIFTYFYATVNPRNLMAFLDLRAEAQALHEIRDVAYQMEKIFRDTMPATWAVWSGNKALS